MQEKSKHFLNLMYFRKKRFIFALIIFLGIMMAFLFAEAIVRIIDSYSPIVNTTYWEQHELYGIKYISNKQGFYIRPAYKTFFSINSAGWRDSEHSIKKAPDTFRILVLGDSFVESFQVPLEKTLFKVLEHRLNEKNQATEYEVIAMGIGGSSPTQQLLALKNEGINYQPDLVIQIFYTLNDIVGNSNKLDFSPYRPYFELKKDRLILNSRQSSRAKSKGVVIDFFREKSYVWRLISDKLGLIRENQLKSNFETSPPFYPPDYQVYKKNYGSDWQNAWGLTERILLETKKVTELAGSQYVLVSLANIEQVDKNYWQEILKAYPKANDEIFELKKPEKLLKEFAQKNTMNYFSLLGEFEKELFRRPNVTLFYWRDGHFNEIGYRLTGESIANYLLENQFLNNP